MPNRTGSRQPEFRVSPPRSARCRACAATTAPGNSPGRSFVAPLTLRAAAAERFGVGPVALALVELPLDVVFHDELRNQVANGLGHRHRVDQVIACLGKGL